MNEQNEYITEVFGFKMNVSGAVVTFGSFLAGINWLVFISVVVMIGGGVIQILAYQRNKIKVDLEIQLLKKQLENKNTAEV
jgi:hypothetical protein